jgi:competence protein ComEC
VIDARLAAPALSAWSAVLAVLLGGWFAGESRVVAALTIASAVSALALILALVLRDATVNGSALAAIAGCIVALLQVQALWAGPVSQLARDSRNVTVWGIVQADPKPRAGPAWERAPQATFPLATSAMQRGTERVAIAVPISVACSCTIGDVAVGSSVRLKGRLSPSRNPTSAAQLRLAPDAVMTPVDNPGAPDAVANVIRRELRQALAGIAPGPASLIAGLSTGDVSLMPQVLADQMRATGMSHLTAVSGANVAIVLACVLGIAIALRARMRTRVALSLIAIVGFVILVRPEPSVIRAAVMGAVVVVSMLSGGRRAGPAVLAVAVLLLLLLAPGLALSWAFALSVAATLGIVMVAARAERWLPVRTPPAVAIAFGITVGAQLAAMPVLLLMGVNVSWVSVPANILAGIAVAPVTVLGLLAALTAPVAMPIAVVIAHLGAVPASFIAWIASSAVELPAAGLTWPAGIPGIALLVACAIAAPTLRRHWRRPFTWALAIALLLLLMDPPGSRGWPPEGWIVVACDVGQGDALVVRGSGTPVLVVDTGPDTASLSTCLRELNVEHIGVLVLTHFHADHVGGVEAALALPVDAIIVTPVKEPPETYAIAARALAGHPLTMALPGMRIRLPGLEAQVLWPAERIDAGSVPNNASVVLDVVANGTRLLLSGDVEREAQAQLARMPARAFDVVKLPHHGSANLDDGFVRWSQAPITLVSVGSDNEYGHPAAAALQAWSTSIVGRTDTDGSVAVVRRDGKLAMVRRG